MSSPTDKVAQAKATLAQAQKNRSESVSRPAARDVPAQTGITDRPGSASSNRGGATGADGNQGRTGATAGPAGGATTREPLPEEDEEEEEDDEPAPVPVRRTTATTPPGTGRQTTPPRAQAQQTQAGQATVDNPDSFNNLVNNMSDEHKALLIELVDINGQDSYDAMAAGIGKLKRSEYLLIPYDFQPMRVEAIHVGKPRAHNHMSIKDIAQIYAMNKARAPAGSDDKVFAMLRTEAVKCGWIVNQREIEMADPPADALTILANDLREIREKIATIKTASFILPLIAEHVFRTFGHHFITTDASNYTDRYNSTLRSCLCSEVVNLLPPPVMFHAALHWVSPQRSREVLMAQINAPTIPDAIKIRANAAPAGTAILTTTSAILTSMEAVGLAGLFATHGGFDIDLIHSVTRKVKSNPPQYHKTYFAYGIAPLSRNDSEQLDKAKEEAIKFAPFAQAYINTYMREAALGRAQALKKHAEQNPIQMRRATTLFRNIGRTKVSNVADLFITTLGRGDDDDDF